MDTNRNYLPAAWNELAAMSIAERFHASYVPVTESGCWLWEKSVNNTYGQMYIPGARRDVQRTHRVSWKLHNGPIPDGLQVCHKCDTPLCVNPKHLFLGTAADNNADKVAKGRWKRGGRFPVGTSHPLARLTPELVLEARKIFRDHVAISAMAERIGVNVSTVQRAASGQTWRHI